MMMGTGGLGPMYPTIPHMLLSVAFGGGICELAKVGLLGERPERVRVKGWQMQE